MKTAERTAPKLYGEGLESKNRQRVAFVCSGNTCRSPMAEAVFNHIFSGSCKRALSFGLFAYDGEPISENAVLALRQRGIPSTEDNRYEEHTATRVSEERLLSCDMIIGITEAHTLELLGRFPSLASRIYSMPKAIQDPYGGDLECYRNCLEDIISGIKELFHIEY